MPRTNQLTVAVCTILVSVHIAATQAAESPSAEEVWEKLISPSLTDQEKSKLLWSLPEETRKEVNAMGMEDMRKREKQAKDERKQFVALLQKGTGQILSVRGYYDRISKIAIKHSQNDQQKRRIQIRSDNNIQDFDRLITVNTPENNIALWKIYEPIVKKTWATYKDSEVTPEQLAAIEVGLIDPLIKSLEKDVAALPSSTPQTPVK